MLGICIAVFVVSLVFIVSGVFGGLSPNWVTGNVVGVGRVVGLSFVGLILSLVVGLIVLVRIFIVR